MSKKSLKDLLPETLGNQEDASGSSNLQELKDQVEQLVSQEFPKRLTALSELYKTPRFSDLEAQNKGRIATLRDLSPDADKGVLDGKFKSNPFVDSMFDDLRPHVQQLLQDVIVIRMVMNMRVAEMEVNSQTAIGQSLQMHLVAVITMLAKIEAYCNEIMGSWAEYHGKRGEVIKDFNPKVSDHLRVVIDLDDQMMASLCFSLGHLISFYISLEDAVNETNAMLENAPDSSIRFGKSSMYR